MPIQFTCPHCGKATEVADQYAGSSGPCSNCGQTITIPGQQQPFSTPSGYGDAPEYAASSGYGPPKGYGAPGGPQKRGGLPAWAILLIVGAFALPCLCVLPAMLLPAVQTAREAARRSACRNNLRQIELAIQNYHDQNGEFPPSAIYDANGKPLHSWRVLILPYMERQDLYSQYDFNEPWDGPNNRKLADRMPQVYGCPSEHTEGDSDTSYMVVVGDSTALQPVTLQPGQDPRRIRSNRSLADITDGASNTIVVVEVAHSGVNWIEPVDLDFEDAVRGINATQSGDSISSQHPLGVNAAFLDGRVDFISDETSPAQVESMIDVRDGR